MSENENPGEDYMDVESQKTTTTESNKKSARGRWRSLNLMLKVQHRLVILVSVANRSSNHERQPAHAPDHQPYSTESEITTTTSSDDALNVYSAEDNNVSDLHLQVINITRIVTDRDFDSLRDFGGVSGFAEALGTDLVNGIPSEDHHRCCRVIPCRRSNLEAPIKGLVRRLLSSSNNCMICLLLLSAVLSIGFGIKEEGIRTGWIEGMIILIAVGILVVVPLIRNLWNNANSQLPAGKNKLMEETDMGVDVVRGGTRERIFISDVLLGDIVCLKRGDRIPADGLFVSGDFLKLDDGSKAVINGPNPFLFYGAEVMDGEARMLVTSVGANTVWAETMSKITHFNRKVPFASQLDKLNTCKQIVGIILSIFIIIVLFLRFELAKQQVNSGLPDIKGKPIAIDEFRNLVKRIVTKPSGKISTPITSLTMLLVGVVEILPLCITLAVTFWKREGIAFAQKLSACVAAGSATIIVTDKTGGLTLEPLEVDKVWIGKDEITESSVIDSDIGAGLCEGISTSLLFPHVLHTAVEEPLLSWAVRKFCIKLETVRQCMTLLQIREMIEEEGRELLITRKNINEDVDSICLHCRGLATKVIPKCSFYYNKDGMLNEMDEQKREVFQQIVEQIQSNHLNKVIAFAYKQTNVPTSEETGLTLLGLVGLKVSKREDIKKTIQACRIAGARVILVSGDDVENLEKIAQEFGIIRTNPNGHRVTITGEDFRSCTDEERREMANHILVMGNALPSDKRLLISSLQRNGDSVAFIGIGTNDVPALKEAEVGLALGSWSDTTARASADIVIWDTNISFLVSLLRYGRCIYSNIQKYIQLDLTMLVSWILITSIIIATTGNIPITTIQSAWINLVVPLIGGLALLTEPPSEKSMETPPERNKAVITKAMWTNVIFQAIYQATILVTFQFKGQAIPGINRKIRKTIIFNSYVLCQLFKQFNSRDLTLKNNFRKIHKNQWFWVALCVTVVLQEVFIETAHRFAGDARLNWGQWGICFIIGMVSLAIDCAEKFILGFIKN